MSSIETYLDNPLQAWEDEKSKSVPRTDQSYSTYRTPLAPTQAKVSNQTPTKASVTSALNDVTHSRPVSRVERKILTSLAYQKGFSKTCDQPIMIQFKNKSGTAAVNVYTTKGTVVLQGKGGLKETRKGCCVSDFLDLLGKVNSLAAGKHQFVGSVHQDSDHARDASNVCSGHARNASDQYRDHGNDATENETDLRKSVRKSGEDAS